MRLRLGIRGSRAWSRFQRSHRLVSDVAVPDLSVFGDQLRQVQAIYGMLLGFMGFDVDGNKKDDAYIRMNIKWSKEPSMGGALLYHCLLLLAQESIGRCGSEEQAVQHWLDVFTQVDKARMAQLPPMSASARKS